MSVWSRIAALVGSFSQRTGAAGAVARVLDPDTWLPGGKDAAFTLALIALSAKMAMADGAVTASEIRAFYRNVEIPAGHRAVRSSGCSISPGRMSPATSPMRARSAASSPTAPIRSSTCSTACSSSPRPTAWSTRPSSTTSSQVSTIFGFDDARFEQLAAQHVLTDDDGSRSLHRPRPRAGRRRCRGPPRLPPARRRAPPRPADRQGRARGADRRRDRPHGGDQPRLRADHQAPLEAGEERALGLAVVGPRVVVVGRLLRAVDVVHALGVRDLLDRCAGRREPVEGVGDLAADLGKVLGMVALVRFQRRGESRATVASTSSGARAMSGWRGRLITMSISTLALTDRADGAAVARVPTGSLS